MVTHHKQWYLKMSIKKTFVIRNKTTFLLLQPNGSAAFKIKPAYEVHYCPNRHV